MFIAALCMSSRKGKSSMEHQLPAMFIGDAPGLDFLNSVATPVDTPVDWINDGEGEREEEIGIRAGYELH